MQKLKYFMENNVFYNIQNIKSIQLINIMKYFLDFSVVFEKCMESQRYILYLTLN